MMRLPVSPAFEKNNLAITLQTSDYFAPYASVTILSIIENASPKYNYDLLVMTWDMQEKTEEKLISMADGKNNISIRVVDVSREIDPYVKMAVGKSNFERFGATGLIRLVLLDLLEHYDVVLNFDCDMLICGDVSELFQYDISNYYMGAAPDLICYAAFHRQKEIKYTQFTDDLIYNQLKLDDVSEYLNAGMLLLNLKEIRKNYTCSQIIDFARSEGSFFECFEQDTFNGLFKGKKLELPIEWNWLVDSTGFISRAKNVLPKNDKLIVQYFEAEKNAKSYHYVTSRKPWQDASISHADQWWDAAKRVPFWGEILESPNQKWGKRNNIIHSNDPKYLLFVCDSFYQIINIINIKCHFYADVPADLVLCSSTALVECREKIEALNLFCQIIISDYNGRVEYQVISKMPVKEKTLHPENYKYSVSLQPRYTDLFIPVYDYHYYQMLFYQLVNMGLSPAVHIFEDGGSTYMDSFSVLKESNIDHQLYPEKERFTNKVNNVFLYRPALYCGGGSKKIIPIPPIAEKGLVDALCQIFGDARVPKEKYIFFSECFAIEWRVSNEISILDMIAEIVGKENIIIKPHPRAKNQAAIYQLHGYHVFLDDIPWELVCLSQHIEHKVLLAISSNTIWTPLIVAGKSIPAISLLNVMKLSRRPHASTRQYSTFMRKIQAIANEERETFFTPNTLLELKRVIQYIEGEF